MKVIVVSIFYCFICGTHICTRECTRDKTQNLVPTGIVEDCLKFNMLNQKIRDASITSKNALGQIQLLLPKIRAAFFENGGKVYPENTWYFPVQHYTAKAVGGKNGNGYVASGYNYFDGNKHAGHPAHDIFIRDSNQDCLDDLTHKPVNILSITAGIVIATDTSWTPGNELRGGKCVWVYDPASNSIFYYAHNNTVIVKPGYIVKPGDTIATMGRTGLNAWKKRSPTHVHIMQLKLNSNFYPSPYNCYRNLVSARHG